MQFEESLNQPIVRNDAREPIVDRRTAEAVDHREEIKDQRSAPKDLRSLAAGAKLSKNKWQPAPHLGERSLPLAPSPSSRPVDSERGEGKVRRGARRLAGQIVDW